MEHIWTLYGSLFGVAPHMVVVHADSAPSLDVLSKAFGMSPRTMARRLKAEGSSYRQLTDAWRKDRAEQWLRGTRLSRKRRAAPSFLAPPRGAGTGNARPLGVLNTKEIGYRLGFADVASFRRAFKEWTGCTVGEYCASHGVEGAPSARLC